MAFTLPALPYAHDALEPHIDKQTMEIHHGKHHQAYVDNLNKAIAGTPNEGKSLEELVAKAGSISPAVRTVITVSSGKYWAQMQAVALPASWPMPSMRRLAALKHYRKN
jgi:superoxide dismutase